MEYLQEDGKFPEGKPTLTEIVVTLEKFYFIGITQLLTKQKLAQVVKNFRHVIPAIVS